MVAPESPQHLIKQVQQLQHLILQRDSSSLADLGQQLQAVRLAVASQPNEMRWSERFERTWQYPALRPHISAQWPELSFYNSRTGTSVTANDVQEEINDAIDDLTDIADELTNALQLAAVDIVGAVDLLRFTLDTHWNAHITDLMRHLDQLAKPN